jgi:hypothetical protein
VESSRQQWGVQGSSEEFKTAVGGSRQHWGVQDRNREFETAVGEFKTVVGSSRQ